MFALLLALVACASETAPPTPSADPASSDVVPLEGGTPTGGTSGAPTGVPPAPTTDADGDHVEYTWLGSVKGVNFVGEWTSKCPHHGWARNLRIVTGGRWYGTDITTPCEPGKECLWNGLVVLSGTWAKVDDRLVLSVINQAPMKFVSTDAGALVEEGPECTYTKGVSVPPGYTREQVEAEVLSETAESPAPAAPSAKP
jgi:hypothetical protein